MIVPLLLGYMLSMPLQSKPLLQDTLAASFVNPPDSARPWVYFYIMDGTLTKEGITTDFEALKKAGIGGLMFLEVNIGIPRGPVEFMSPQWRQLFKHAVSEATRLGLEITLNAGPGWTGSGGPWVKPEQSMQSLVGSSTEVTGPVHFDAKLPQAPRPRPYFGDSLPPVLKKAADEFYQDVAVLAIPTPSGNDKITDLPEKALNLRHAVSSMSYAKFTLPSPAKFPDFPGNAITPQSGVIDLISKLTADGRLVWDAPPGKWTVLRFGCTTTGACTRPAPEPGIGLESDKMDKAALDAHFEAFVGTLLREIGPQNPNSQGGLKMLHIDSWEMGSQNWTGQFRDEFRKRTGYDLLPYLPVIAGRVVGSLEVSERFLWDLRQVAQELVIENHARHLAELAHKNGMGLSIEPYDMNPTSDMSLGAAADVPMAEFWLHGFDTFFSVTEAASIAHTNGKRVVAAEAFTSSDDEAWKDYPTTMKALGDWAFTAGVNRFNFHRYQHQPVLNHSPGMTMGPGGGYGVHWDRTQTWWDLVPAYHTYLSRCNQLLRQGTSVADVCFLVAEGAPHVFLPPPSATRGTPPDRLSYNFDGCAPDTLIERMSVKNGRLVLPDGMSYRVLVLPSRETMTPKLLRKVRDLVAAGATVVGPRPIKSPSLVGYPQCDDQVKAIGDEVWGACDGVNVREHAFGSGRVYWDARVAPKKVAPLLTAKWIWYPEAGNPAAEAPVGKRFFRRAIQVSSGVQAAQIQMTADNSFDLFVNGRLVGSGDNFNQTYTFDVAPFLKVGENVIEVEAVNAGEKPNPAGLIGAVEVSYRSGSGLVVTTDDQWSGSTSRVEWKPVQLLGDFGTLPWNRQGESKEPDQYGDYRFVTQILGLQNVQPDFGSETPLRYTHRVDGNTDIYFVANPSDKEADAKCVFRVANRQPELWNPVTGEIRELPEFQMLGDQTIVPIKFAPLQSYFVIFRKPILSASSTGPNFRGSSVISLVKGSWNVSFDPKWGGPASVAFPSLEDWTKRPEDGIRHYSGKAVYRKSFDAPVVVKGNRVYLDLGTVKNMAQVRLNGKDLGAVWCAPWRVDVTGALKAKNNQLEITVANLWVNRLIKDSGLPAAKRLTWVDGGNPYSPKSPLVSSGLLGPVRLVKEPQ